MSEPISLGARMIQLHLECNLLSGNPHQNTLIRRNKLAEFILYRGHMEFVLTAIIACVWELRQPVPEGEEGAALKQERRARYGRMLQMAQQLIERSLSPRPFEAIMEIENGRKQRSGPRLYVPPTQDVGGDEADSANGAGPSDSEPEPAADVPHETVSPSDGELPNRS